MSMLAVRGLTKRFGGLVAVDDVSFDVHEGTILAIIGPNGAGKSTAFNLLTGFDTPDSGTVEFEGEILTGLKPHKVTRLGVARTFQNTQLFNEMTVLDNVLFGLSVGGRAGQADRAAAAERRARELLVLAGVGFYLYRRSAAQEPANARGVASQNHAHDQPPAGLAATCISRPIRATAPTAQSTSTAPSKTRRLRSTSTVKSTWPGVSIRLIA